MTFTDCHHHVNGLPFSTYSSPRSVAAKHLTELNDLNSIVQEWKCRTCVEDLHIGSRRITEANVTELNVTQHVW